MKKSILCVLVLSLLSSVSFAETVYVCPKKGGGSEYTTVPKPNCKEMEQKQLTTYQAVRYSESSYSSPSSSSNSVNTDNNSGKRAAEERLEQAKRELEEAKSTRNGNERNYARYQERIKPFEDRVREAEAELNQYR